MVAVHLPRGGEGVSADGLSSAVRLQREAGSKVKQEVRWERWPEGKSGKSEAGTVR